ncbi:MAG TPA: hypothetical protein VN833_20890 [Candidatus Acidoferrales bacterium]|nr:hypothetical protein [Candidatus Acidoferrales bacterium]
MPATLARLGRVDPESLHPMHRSLEVRQDLVGLRARHALVAAVLSHFLNERTERGDIFQIGLANV